MKRLLNFFLLSLLFVTLTPQTRVGIMGGTRCATPRPDFHGPIWIVDGVDVGYKDISADPLSSPKVLIASALDGINADDVIDFRVIKDDEAKIRYGERGRDGVMVVNTRYHLTTQHLMKINGRTLYDITAPVHSREHVIARVIQMRQYNEWKEAKWILSPRLIELDRNAMQLEESDVVFKPFCWNGKLSDRGNWPKMRVTIGEVRILSANCAEVDMCYQDDDDRSFPYTLILALIDNEWMIDDVRWTGFGNTLQSEDAEYTYRTEVDFFTKTGSVDEIITRFREHTHPNTREEYRYNNAKYEVAVMRKMQDLFKTHPEYTPELGLQINNIITDYEAAARQLGYIRTN